MLVAILDVEQGAMEPMQGKAGEGMDGSRESVLSREQGLVKKRACLGWEQLWGGISHVKGSALLC
eukprot:1142468-Pelagomonas_calceolata.AAC.2